MIYFKKSAELFVLIWATWTIFCHSFVHFEFSFNDLSHYSFYPFAIAALSFYFLNKIKRVLVVDKKRSIALKKSQIPVLVKWFLALTVPFIYWVTSTYFLFWTLAVLVLLILYFDATDYNGNGCEIIDPASETIGVSIAIIVAIFLTLVSIRPSADDALYLNMAVATLDQPDQPLLKYDGIHGIIGMPLLEPIYKVHSYEVFVALASHLTSVEPIYLYHLILPTFTAGMVVIAHWLVLRSFQPATCLYALFFVLLTFVCWGDTPRTPANFSLVKLFQGKSIMVSACIALTIYYSIEYVSKKDIKNWLLLSGSLIAAVGFSSSGLIAAPLAMLVVLLGSLRFNKASMATFMIGISSSFYLVIMVCVALFNPYFHFGSTYTADNQATYQMADSLNYVLGDGLRQVIALVSIIACGIGVRSYPNARLLIGMMLIATLVILSPWSANFFAHNVAVDFRWRFLWAIPFPLIIGLCVAGGLAAIRNWRFPKCIFPVFIVLCLFYALLPGTWVLSEKNRTSISLPYLKVPESYEIAKQVKQMTPDKGMVLAPKNISVWLVTFRNHPHVVVSKRNYLYSIAKYTVSQEVKSRLLLDDFVSDQLQKKEFLKALRKIRKRKLDTIVLRLDHSKIERIEKELKTMGYSRNTLNSFGIWCKE